MIEALGSSLLLGYLSPVALFTAAICLLVLRAGASRVFFDIVGTFQATKMINDAQSAGTVFESIYLDTLTGIQESAQELGEIFNNLTDSVVPIARELAEAEIQLDKFLEAGLDVREVREDLEGIGMAFGFAGDQAMDAAAKMAQISGVLGAGSLATGTQIGMEFGLISGMETEAAMQRMINLQQQTKFMTDGINENASAEERATKIRQNSMLVLDQLNTIENRSAATMEQITFVMNQFASQAHLANEEIRSMAALSAVMIETGEEQGKGGRALRMMFARLGSNIGGARDEMERFGVQVVDAEGNMRPLSVMLKELEAGFFAQTSAQQQNTAQVIAGNRHYTRFLKLMTNLDRVRELEIESAMRLFPAMDEIERRRNSELFQLEQSEAALRNYSAALGEALIPQMTNVNMIQANFMKTLAEFAEGPLGFIVPAVMGLAKSFSTVLGPLVNTVITFKSLSISMQTQLAVMRALNQQQQTSNASTIAGNVANKDAAVQYHFQQQALQDLNREREIEKGLLEQNMNLASLSTDALYEYLAAAERDLEILKDKDIIKQRLIEKEEILTELIYRKGAALEQENADKEAANIRDRQQIENAKQNAAAMNGLTMQMMGAGTALMMFGKNQRAMKAGMILNTAAIGAQIYQMIIKNAESIQATFNTKAETLALTENTGALAANTAARGANATVARAGAAAVGMGTKGFGRALMRSAGMMGGMAIAAVGVSYALDKFLFKTKKAKKEVDDLSSSLISATDVLGIMGEEGFTVESSQQIVDEQQAIVDSIRVQYKEGEKLNALDQQRLDTAMKLRDEHQLAIDQTENMANLTKVLAMDSEDLATFASMDIDQLRRSARGMEIHTGSVSENLAETIKTYEDTQDALGAYGEEFVRIFKETGDIEQAKAALQGYLDIIEDGLAGNGAGSIADSVEVANNTLTDFLNTREEMFHGFKADKLTGDLVRQVQQQGVETLITSTEVVMTNVFNGMTIPEMADLLIEEIEIRGRANGFNVTANVA